MTQLRDAGGWKSLAMVARYSHEMTDDLATKLEQMLEAYSEGGERDFGLHQAKQALLDAISAEGVSDANRKSLNRTLGLFRGLETLVLSNESRGVRVPAAWTAWNAPQQRGVHFKRDELPVELVVFMTLSEGLISPM